MFSKKKIEYKNLATISATVAKGVSSMVSVLMNSQSWKKRRELKLTEQEMLSMCYKLEGKLIHDKIDILILKHIIDNYGSVKQQEAYAELKEIAHVSIKKHLKSLVKSDG